MDENKKIIQVQIVAEIKANCSYVVDMDEEDYRKYEEIINSQMTRSDMSYAILDIANKYGIYDMDNIDMEEPEDVEFYRMG